MNPNSLNETLTAYDVATALQGLEGAYIVERAGQKALVICVAGHSIASWTPVGEITPLTVTGNPPYTISPINVQLNAAARLFGSNAFFGSTTDQQQQPQGGRQGRSAA